MKLKIKTNDKVAVMRGKDKGKTGKVIQVLPTRNQLVIDGINIMYKHLRSQKKGEKGQRVQFNGPINVANVLLVCPKCGKNSRIGFKLGSINTDGKTKKTKVRICRHCQEVID